MKLSISNIGWRENMDEAVYALMKAFGFSGLEIAPTRIFPERPYTKKEEAKSWSRHLLEDHGFIIPSMQSIWFGRNENMFRSEQEREILLNYTKEAIDFAEAAGSRNLVFGCPRNRNIPEGASCTGAEEFFREAGAYAARHGTVIGMEANPAIYHTNYMNDTVSALELVERIDSPGFRLNLDLGTMIANGEDAGILKDKVRLINHVHISEPGLRPIQKRSLHEQVRGILEAEHYENFVSIEMGTVEETGCLRDAMEYVQSVFG